MSGTLIECPADGRFEPLVERVVPGAVPAVRAFPAIGTTAAVAVTCSDMADLAAELLAHQLAAVDAAYSRFRPDSELRVVERTGGGRPVTVSPLLYEALEVSCAVAVMTAGIVDPTIGSALIDLGYDRDFEELDQIGHPYRSPRCDGSDPRPTPAPGWWQIVLDPDRRTVTVPPGVHVDLGSSGKAFAADRAARHLADALGCGVLVSLGGDVSVSGPVPDGGWPIGIAPTCTTPADAVDQVVSITGGGLATSGTTARSWTRNGRRVHHIVDPWTGEAALPVWALVSTTGRNCVEANAWSTAAVVWGEDALGNLEAQRVAARLVRSDGNVIRVGNWPDDRTAGDSVGSGVR